nr:hypothetical protein [Tanacetum cinerariifolium]
PTGKPVNPNRPKLVSTGRPKPVFAGRPNPVFADQPNPVSAGQPNTVSDGDKILGPRLLNIQPKIDHMKAVPPPLTGNYMPPSNIPNIDESQMEISPTTLDAVLTLSQSKARARARATTIIYKRIKKQQSSFGLDFTDAAIPAAGLDSTGSLDSAGGLDYASGVVFAGGADLLVDLLLMKMCPLTHQRPTAQQIKLDWPGLDPLSQSIPH